MSEQSSQGYPEEAPPGADPSGGDHRDKSPAHEEAERAPDNDDGQSTGDSNTDD